MQRKMKKECTLHSHNIEYVLRYQEGCGDRSFSAALDRIIQEHQELSCGRDEKLAELVVQMFSQKYENLFTRLRLATNATDFNTQLVIEVLNSLLLNLDINQPYQSSKVKSDVIKSSEAEIKARIAHMKQIKDNKAKQEEKR